MSMRKRELARRFDELDDRLADMQRSMDKIEIATIVRDPTSALSAEAYDGLRKQIIATVTERTAHLHQLARFAEAAGGVSELAPLVREWMQQAHLVRVDEPDERCFDVLGGNGDVLRPLRPAYVDGNSGRVIVRGQAERMSEPAGEPVVTPASERVIGQAAASASRHLADQAAETTSEQVTGPAAEQDPDVSEAVAAADEPQESGR